LRLSREAPRKWMVDGAIHAPKPSRKNTVDVDALSIMRKDKAQIQAKKTPEPLNRLGGAPRKGGT